MRKAARVDFNRTRRANSLVVSGRRADRSKDAADFIRHVGNHYLIGRAIPVMFIHFEAMHSSSTRALKARPVAPNALRAGYLPSVK
jgi:hypothetical protein